jgi:hypothetical protein
VSASGNEMLGHLACGIIQNQAGAAVSRQTGVRNFRRVLAGPPATERVEPANAAVDPGSRSIW